MANTYFKFKQFTVEQGQCAMKVSTDACIQGAWTPIEEHVQTVLDIGAGTGLLSLMLAQKTDAVIIDAVEIEAKAAEQAEDNFKLSQWSNRLSVINDDVKKLSNKHYDMIITNPPFFNNSLQGKSAQRNTARHTNELSFDDLFHSISMLLATNGYASVMLPPTEFKLFESIVLQNDWHVFNRLNIIPKKNRDANRVVGLIRKGEVSTPNAEDLVIKEEGESYTKQFVELLQPYYLYL